MGKIVLEVKEIDSETAARRTDKDARDIIKKMEENRGNAKTLSEKILVMVGRLDSLGPIISSIDQLAEVVAFIIIYPRGSSLDTFSTCRCTLTSDLLGKSVLQYIRYVTHHPS